MESSYETFWNNDSFAVVGHGAKRSFPLLTYRGLKRMGKSVFPVDPSALEVDGDCAYRDLSALPRAVDAVVLEVPREETAHYVDEAARAGVHDLWIHQQTETPEALKLAAEKGLDARSGNCAVMYVTPGFTYHSIHKWIAKAIGRY